MTIEKPTLLPCPFCGEPPRMHSRQDEDLFTHNVVEWIGINCIECGYGFDWPVTCDVGTVQRWNTRAVRGGEKQGGGQNG